MIFSEQREQVVSLLSIRQTVTEHLDLGYIRLNSLYLARQGSHLRCSINDVRALNDAHRHKSDGNTPPATATLGINSHHQAGNMAVATSGLHG